MCCVFTCCGWMIDLFQRLWTFTMSCCISSAVCCVLFMSSMSGIAMGYNYSLAEYIDLKETNVSVYLKRGVFDDEVADDMDWRRSGRMPVAGHIKDSDPFLRREATYYAYTVVTGNSGEETIPPRAGRRMDDSIIQSDDRNKFEGSLMKLTAKPIDLTITRADIADKVDEVLYNYPKNSLDQLKAIHSLANMRRNNMNRATVQYSDKTTVLDERILLPGARRNMIPEPDTPDKHNIYMDGRAVPFEHVTYKINPIRNKVPDASIVEAANWFMPKGQIPPEYKRTMPHYDYDNYRTTLTLPTPIRYRNEPQRPTRVMSVQVDTKPTQPTFDKEGVLRNMDTRRLENAERMKAQNNLLLDKANFPNFRKAGYGQTNEDMSKSDESDYEEQAIKGLPLRSKRNIESYKDDVVVKSASYKYVPNIILSILGKKKDEGKMDDLGDKWLRIRNITTQEKQNFKSDLGNISNPNGNNTNNLMIGRRNQNITIVERDLPNNNNYTINFSHHKNVSFSSMSKINDSVVINVLPKSNSLIIKIMKMFSS